MACPICSKDSAPGYRPFCSKRCADVDLAKWLRGDYVIPGPPLEEVPTDEEPHDLTGHKIFRLALDSTQTAP